MEEEKNNMEEKGRDLIGELLKLYEEEQENILQNEPSFFQILGRTYDEDLISRMLAYVLKNDKILVWKLLVFYRKEKGIYQEDVEEIEVNSVPKHFKVEEVQCEKSMLNGRVDIFVEASDNDKRYTITIENKIFSWEHDEQTQTYYNYVSDRYKKNCINAYLFLKPNFNASPISCDKFASISYNKFLKMISDTKDYRINDMKKHIEEYLTMSDIILTKVDTKILNNLTELRNTLKETEDKLTAFKRQVFSELCNGCINELEYNYYAYESKKGKEAKYDYWKEFAEKNKLVVEIVDDETVFKIYRACDKYDQWFYYKSGDGRKESYYFYVELKFEGNDPNNILVQKIVRRYGPKAEESIIDKYIKNVQLDGEWKWDWYILSKEKFSCDKEILSKQWKEELLKWASEILNKYIKEMEDIFKNFKEWKEQQTAE